MKNEYNADNAKTFRRAFKPTKTIRLWQVQCFADVTTALKDVAVRAKTAEEAKSLARAKCPGATLFYPSILA